MIILEKGSAMTNLGAIREAADLIKEADSLLVMAGAGMGVDSSLPDYRGDQGFWKAYPALGRKSLGFRDMANRDTFSDNPRLA
jgi:NAD-dependent SIR2 family protein deacetylase